MRADVGIGLGINMTLNEMASFYEVIGRCRELTEIHWLYRIDSSLICPL